MAPVRICDIGGWTDTWFSRHGAVFNIGIKPYVEVTISTYRQIKDRKIILILENFKDTYSLNPDKIECGKHPLIETTIDIMEIPCDISMEIKIFSAAPSGASMGTSAAVCVALIGALDALTPGRLTPHEVAYLAHRVETEKLGLQSGIQDQLCSAYGGINFIQISSFPHCTVSPVNVTDEFRLDLEKRFILIYIGMPHNSSEVHKLVIKGLGETAERDPRIQKLRELAKDAKRSLNTSNLQALGEVMNRNTEIQRALHPNLVCKKFEDIIEAANLFGALGCKVNGAGGDGGSITILGDGDEKKKKKLIKILQNQGYQSIPLSLSPQGLNIWEA